MTCSILGSLPSTSVWRHSHLEFITSTSIESINSNNEFSIRCCIHLDYTTSQTVGKIAIQRMNIHSFKMFPHSASFTRTNYLFYCDEIWQICDPNYGESLFGFPNREITISGSWGEIKYSALFFSLNLIKSRLIQIYFNPVDKPCSLSRFILKSKS